MNSQRKRISANILSSNAIANAEVVVAMSFNDSAAVNVHGVNVSLGVFPLGGVDPGESMRGRWYVATLPRSIVNNGASLAAWLDGLDNFTNLANNFESAPMIWGSGAFAAHSTDHFNMTFQPRTSRNMEEGSALFVIVVADDIDGLLDDWRATAHVTAFTSS